MRRRARSCGCYRRLQRLSGLQSGPNLGAPRMRSGSMRCLAPTARRWLRRWVAVCDAVCGVYACDVDESTQRREGRWAQQRFSQPAPVLHGVIRHPCSRWRRAAALERRCACAWSSTTAPCTHATCCIRSTLNPNLSTTALSTQQVLTIAKERLMGINRTMLLMWVVIGCAAALNERGCCERRQQ